MKDKSVEIEKVANGYVAHFRPGDSYSIGEAEHTRIYEKIADLVLDVGAFLEKN